MRRKVFCPPRFIHTRYVLFNLVSQNTLPHCQTNLYWVTWVELRFGSLSFHGCGACAVHPEMLFFIWRDGDSCCSRGCKPTVNNILPLLSSPPTLISSTVYFEACKYKEWLSLSSFFFSLNIVISVKEDNTRYLHTPSLLLIEALDKR